VDDAKLELFVEQFGLDMDEGGEGRQYLEIIAYAGSVGLSILKSYERSTRPGSVEHFLSFFKSYIMWKEEFGYVDFTDMLQRYADRATKPTGHTMLAIDEAQDLTPLHWRVVEKFMELNPKCRVLVGGDDDQCIYTYAGAIHDGAARFAERFQAGVRVLDQSYRVPRSVFDLSQLVIARVAERVDKRYLPKEEQGRVNYVARGFEEFPYEATRGGGDDHLILYSDRFVRKEVVEPVLHDLAIPYVAVSGFPSPCQSKAGRAMAVAHKGALEDADVTTLKRGLTEKGLQVLKAVGPAEVARNLRDRDLSLVSVHWSAEEYFHRVDWTAPPSVRISTIHGAKGMEARQVHLISGQSGAAVDHSFREPDAPHRLFYVGVTRAAETLSIYPGDNNYELQNFER
jgi:DNA helicase-2/ATP-dependent DNA helicase PcrA